MFNVDYHDSCTLIKIWCAENKWKDPFRKDMACPLSITAASRDESLNSECMVKVLGNGTKRSLLYVNTYIVTTPRTSNATCGFHLGVRFTITQTRDIPWRIAMFISASDQRNFVRSRHKLGWLEQTHAKRNLSDLSVSENKRHQTHSGKYVLMQRCIGLS